MDQDRVGRGAVLSLVVIAKADDRLCRLVHIRILADDHGVVARAAEEEHRVASQLLPDGLTIWIGTGEDHHVRGTGVAGCRRERHLLLQALDPSFGERGEDAIRKSREVILESTERADAVRGLPVRFCCRAGISRGCGLRRRRRYRDRDRPVQVELADDRQRQLRELGLAAGIVDVAADVAKDLADLLRLLDVLQERRRIGAVAAAAIGRRLPGLG